MIYLDNNATTQIDPKVMEAMLPFLDNLYANPSSQIHAAGRYIHHHVEQARKQVADILQVDPQEIIFTSSATESINLAMHSVAMKYQAKGKHIICSAIEHSAVLSKAAQLQTQGFSVEYCPVNSDGVVDLDYLQSMIRKDTILICIMHANNETGILQPIEAIAQICIQHGILYLCDATQTAGKLKLNPKSLNIPMLAFSAHKFHGPKGIGCLFASRKKPKVMIEPLIYGGGHEFGLRSGTLNVPGIIGLAKALEIADLNQQNNETYVRELRDTFEKLLFQKSIPFKITGNANLRMAQVSHLIFPNKKASELISYWFHLIAASTGAACSTGHTSESHVLSAMRIEKPLIQSAIRFSFCKFNTIPEIHEAVKIIASKHT